ncbi:hypothetical protein ACMGD3_21875 [Lysinibacillus sphaericus]|uniref:hypothetical protein n=1 Tax=Lysinibacillus sphaericus TaxID=1421 RepID=UPI003F78E531
MFFYTLSQGAYSYYEPVTLYHQEEISKTRFFEMCQEVVQQGKVSLEDVLKALCEQYGFAEAVSQIEINCYADFEGITKYKIDEDTKYFSLEP